MAKEPFYAVKRLTVQLDLNKRSSFDVDSVNSLAVKGLQREFIAGLLQMVPDTYKAETASKRKQGQPDRSDRTLSNVDIGSSFAQREAFIAARRVPGTEGAAS